MIKDLATARNPLPLGKPSKAFDIVGFLKRYGMFVLLFGGFLFAMLTPLIFVVKKPYYEVHALMRVDPIAPTVLSSSEETSIVNYYDRYANTVAQSMTTIDILSKTLDAMEPAKREALFPKEIPSSTCAEILQRLVKVQPVSRTHVLDLMISGSKPEGLAEFLNTLMQVYMEQTRKTSNISNSERIGFLYAQKNVITKELSSIEKNLDSLTKDIGTSSFSETFNIAGKQNESLGKYYTEAMNEKITAEASYNAIEQANKALTSISLDPLIEDLVLNNHGLNLTESWTNQQLQELRSTTDGLTAINPDRIAVEERMKSMNSYAAQLRDNVRSVAQKIVVGKRDIQMQTDMVTAAKNLMAANVKADSLKSLLEKSGKESKRVSIGIHRGEYLTANWQNKFDLLNNIEKRITEVEVEKKAPLRLFVLSIARTPNQPLKSNVNNIIMMMLLGSFGLVAGSFAIYEFFDDTIRSDKELTHALGYPPIQTIVNVSKPQKDEGSFSIAPDDFRSHQIGSLAVKFVREKERDNARIILFTGTDKGVGASSITMGCAKALARLVPKVLVIDANIENIALVAQDDEFQISLPGLFDYLQESVRLEESIISTAGDNIDMMYSGNITGNTVPRRRLAELLRELKERYDLICIDASPLLESHLTEQIAINSDIVALIALGDSSRCKDLRRSAIRLVQLGVPGIAPILNFGGIRKSLSLVEMFDNPPEIVKKLLPEKVIALIKKSPAGLRMIDRLLKIAQQFQQKQ